MAVTLNHDASSRPDFAAPIYAGHFGDIPVPADVPPLSWCTRRRPARPASISTAIYAAWHAAGNPVELHIYARGGHGFGMNKLGCRWLAGSSGLGSGWKRRGFRLTDTCIDRRCGVTRIRRMTAMIHDDVAYRDLNKNGRPDPYEDPRGPIEERVADLLAQMTLEEKAGLMFHTFVPVNPDDATLTGPG